MQGLNEMNEKLQDHFSHNLTFYGMGGHLTVFQMLRKVFKLVNKLYKLFNGF